jgi:hypothetical protein
MMSKKLVNGMLTATLSVAFVCASAFAASEGWYRIAPKVRPDGSFDLPGVNGSSGKLSLYASDGGTDQKWYLKDVGNWKWELIPRSAMGKRIDVTGGSTGDFNGNQLQIWDANGGDWQRWYLYDYGDGTWEIKSALGSQRAIDLDANNPANDTKIQLWDKYSNDAQKWRFNNVSVASVYQDCAFGGKRIELVPGNYTMTDLGQIGIGNDWVSSLRVNAGYKITGYWDDNFTGSSYTWTGDDDCLVNEGWNDAITSLKVEANAGGSWHVDFIDNFDGSALNRNNWQPMVLPAGAFNGEWQRYVDDERAEGAFWVSNGELKIKVNYAGGGFNGYTSGRLVTKNKIEMTKGAWEAKIVMWKSGSATGIWPAWWMLGSRLNQAPILHSDENLCWPLHGANEIDIFEAASNTNTNQGNFIKDWGAGCEVYDSRNFVTANGVDMYAYNTYRVEWSPDGNLRLIVNGQVKRTLAPSDWQGVWDTPYYNILNVAIGGSLGGSVNFGSGDWAGITVDYVKHEYWQ